MWIALYLQKHKDHKPFARLKMEQAKEGKSERTRQALCCQILNWLGWSSSSFEEETLGWDDDPSIPLAFPTHLDFPHIGGFRDGISPRQPHCADPLQTYFGRYLLQRRVHYPQHMIS